MGDFSAPNGHSRRDSPPSAPMDEDGNEVEDQMLLAAIEASKKEAAQEEWEQYEYTASDDDVQEISNPYARLAEPSGDRPAPSELASPSDEADDVQVISPPVASRQLEDVDDQAAARGEASPADEWGGMSSEEHAEAAMLEAAFFGVPSLAQGDQVRSLRNGPGFHPGLPFPPGARFPLPATGRSRFVHPLPPYGDYEDGQDDVSEPPQPMSPSVVTARLLREQQDEDYLASLAADREKEFKVREEQELARAVERQHENEKLARQQEAEVLQRQLEAKRASLPFEPPANDEGAVMIRVRMPDGSQVSRRFLKATNLRSLFDVIDVSGAARPGSYRLVRQYPRRTYTDSEQDCSLEALGLTSKQEAMFMELK